MIISTEAIKIKLASFWKKAHRHSFPINVVTSELTSNNFKTGRAVGKKAHIKTEFVMVRPDLLLGLDDKDVSMVIKIMSELKRNNALWYFDYRAEGGRKERAILSLRKKGILEATGIPGIHIVNPWDIRRGNIEITVVATNMLVNQGSITKKSVKHLLYPENAALNAFYQLMAD